MKIERTRRAAPAARAGAAAYARRAEAMTAAKPVEAPAAVASVLGIPEAELTPRVRGAIMDLMREVETLRHDLELARSRLDAAERTADLDHLLPLFNRRAFVRELTRAIAMAERYGTPSSLVYFDLDDFKLINDSFGHAAGDAVLAHFSRTLLDHVRDSDVVGRLGGDEFGVILSHADQTLAHKKSAALADTLSSSPAQWQGSAIPVSFSYGTFEVVPGENADTAIARADEAMYAHKRTASR